MNSTHARFLRPKGNVIDGQVSATIGGTLPVEDPATGEAFTEIPASTAADVDAAVLAARELRTRRVVARRS